MTTLRRNIPISPEMDQSARIYLATNRGGRFDREEGVNRRISS